MEVREQIDANATAVQIAAVDSGLLFAGGLALAAMVVVPLVSGIEFESSEMLGLAAFLMVAGVFCVEQSVLRVELRIASGLIIYRNPWLPLVYRGALAVADVHRFRLGARHRGKGRLQLVDIDGRVRTMHLIPIDEAEGLGIAGRLTELLDRARGDALATPAARPPLIDWNESFGRGVFRSELRIARRQRARAIVSAAATLAIATIFALGAPTVAFALLELSIFAVIGYFTLRQAFARVGLAIDGRSLQFSRRWLRTSASLAIPLETIERLSVVEKQHKRSTAFLIRIERTDGRTDELPREFDDPEDADWVCERITRGLEAVRAHAEYR